jgi:predicted nucleotide-binding protein
MNADIEPDVAIEEIIRYSNHIDPLLKMSYRDGERVKTQLNTRIRAFVRAAFIDDDKKISDYERDLESHAIFISPTSELLQKKYVEDLETMRDHLITYKEELELLSKSRKRISQSVSQNTTASNETRRMAIFSPAIPIPSPTEEYVIDKKGNIGTREKNSNKIFVVHGHNDLVKDAVAAFLRTLDLDPIILHQQPSMGKTIIEKIEHYSEVGFAVILLTQDDLGCTLGPPEIFVTEEKSSFLSKKEKSMHAGKGWGQQRTRARQNVIFEFGLFVGKLGRHKVAALCEEGLERPSDIDGVVYISLDRGGQWKESLIKEIKAADITIGKKSLQ